MPRPVRFTLHWPVCFLGGVSEIVYQFDKLFQLPA